MTGRYDKMPVRIIRGKPLKLEKATNQVLSWGKFRQLFAKAHETPERFDQ